MISYDKEQASRLIGDLFGAALGNMGQAVKMAQDNPEAMEEGDLSYSLAMHLGKIKEKAMAQGLAIDHSFSDCPLANIQALGQSGAHALTDADMGELANPANWASQPTLKATARAFATTHFGCLGFDVDIIMQDEAVTRNIKTAAGLFGGTEPELLAVAPPLTSPAGPPTNHLLPLRPAEPKSPPPPTASASAPAKPPVGEVSSEAVSPPFPTRAVATPVGTTIVSKKSWCKRLSCCP